MMNQNLTGRISEIQEKVKSGYVNVVSAETVKNLLSDIRFLLAELNRVESEYAAERATHNLHVTELNEQEKEFKRFRENGSGCYISSLKAEIEGYCNKNSLSLSSDEYEDIAQRISNNTELNDMLLDVITSAVDEHLLGLPDTMQAVYVSDINNAGAFEEVREKGYDRFYSCGKGLLFTLHMNELCENEVKELAELCVNHYAVGFKGNRVLLWRY